MKLGSPSPLAIDTHSDDETEKEEKLLKEAKRKKLKEKLVSYDPASHTKVPKPREENVAFVEDGFNTQQNGSTSQEMVERAILHLQKKYMHGLLPDSEYYSL